MRDSCKFELGWALIFAPAGVLRRQLERVIAHTFGRANNGS